MPLPSPAASPHVTSVRPQAEEPPAEPDAVRQQQRSVAVFPHMVTALRGICSDLRDKSV